MEEQSYVTKFKAKLRQREREERERERERERRESERNREKIKREKNNLSKVILIRIIRENKVNKKRKKESDIRKKVTEICKETDPSSKVFSCSKRWGEIDRQMDRQIYRGRERER